jgi:hypothetical protein
MNFVRLRPSAREITRMETVIVWAARYLKDFPQLLRTVQLAALARAGLLCPVASIVQCPVR